MLLTQQELQTTHDVLDGKLEELQTSGRSDEAVIEKIEILINVMSEIQDEITGAKHVIVKYECETCKEAGMITHRKGSYPDYCPHCGLDGFGAPGTTTQERTWGK